MNFKHLSLFVFVGLLLASTLACSFTVDMPSTTPTVIVQPVNTQITSTPAITSSAIPGATLENTLIPTVIPSTLVQSTQISNTCSTNWFFTFDTQHQSLGAYCPKPVKFLEAVGQDFEGGRVYRYAPDPDYPADQRGTIYVIYNNGEWATFPDNWDATQPSNDPNLVAPADRYQPVDAIGKIWREVSDVRTRLGWALEPQVSFQGRFQDYVVTSNGPSGDSHYYFIDHGKWGLVLLLNSVDMGPNKWEVVGSYQ